MSMKQVSVSARTLKYETYGMQEIETWVAALGQYDNHEFEESLKTFDKISDTSKILFNCGMIQATLGQHASAVECFQRAINRDTYLAIAYFQQGVSNFLVGDFEEALANFNDTLLYLRGNRYINYEQLGLKYKLYSCEVLFNRGLCYVYLKQKDVGISDLRYAAKEKETADHDVIDEAIQEGAEEFTVFSIGVGIVYRPNSAKVKNLKTRDYLGKARVVAAAEHSNVQSPEATRAALQAAAGRNLDDRAPESISFAASNLVRPNLHSRTRQQSEPPIHRNVFPPTPPPENENEKLRPAMSISATTALPNSTFPTLSSLNLQNSKQLPSTHEFRQPPQNHPLRPEPLKLSQSSFTSLESKDPPPSRIGTTRSASERPSHREHFRRDREQRRPSQPDSRRLFMEVHPGSPGEADIDEHPDEELYSAPSLSAAPSHHRRTRSSANTVSTHRSSGGRNGSRTRHRSRSRQASGPSMRTHYSIEEEDETTGDAGSTGSSLDEFEILHNAGGGLSRSPESGNGGTGPILTLPKTTYRPPRTQSERPDRTTRARSSSRHRPAPSHAHREFHGGVAGAYKPPPPQHPTVPELKNIRIKLHHADDARFILLPPTVSYDMLVEKIREKLKMPRDQQFKVKVRDEDGDLITMGDSDDWDMVVQGVRKEFEGSALGDGESGGSEQGGGMGKMEVWVA
ncbi:uncharacterized protein KY384_005486 [Bacidia gigantensis]|uniref:uncharacterized protein n=1 Tax=Bacidia gigantensis TaxID=2732470 RepID=UPI001D03CA4A|nr:uncharacterized protein KY384_005486 [Bacidia gigantensis]KAG8530004.1 hypothetical protein KY384_005486 [Bacidia gigantensis]